MAVTRIKNNQITDSTVNAAAKLQDYSVTSGKIANNLTYGSDLTVTGNLTVQGNVTAIDTIDLVVEDPLILLAKEQTGTPTLDIGFIGKRGTQDNIAFVWDESADQFVAVFTTSEVTNTTVSINSYASLQVLDITAANASITGNVTFSGNIVGNLGVTGNVLGGNLNSNAAVTGVTITASGNLEGGNAVITGDVSGATGSFSGNVLAANLNANSGVTATTVTATTVTATGNLVGGNANITNGVYAATGNFTGNVAAGNISTSGELAVASISASGNITGGNLVSNADVTTVTVSASGNVLSGNLNSNAAVTGVTVTANGNLVGGNAVITNGVFASSASILGNVLADNLNSNGAVTGDTVLANTITAIGNLNGNNAVVTNIVSSNNISALGNVLAGNVNSNAAVTGVTVTATGNLVGGNANITNGVYSTTVTATGNIGGANVNATSGVYTSTINATGNIAGGNVNITSGVYSATGNFTGNVSANYFIGNGSQLTGIDATQIQFGNSNVKVSEANGNITVSVTGVSNVVVFTPTSVEITGEINASGNVLAANVNANGAITAANATVTGNVNSGNINATSGVYAATGDYTGNITAGNIQSNAGITGVTVTATGNLVGGNANVTNGVFATNITATGNVNGGNLNSDSIVGSNIVITADNVEFSLTGNIDMGQRWINDLADPVQAFDAATKQYVDDAVSAGLTIHSPVLLESPTALSATYAQGGTTATVTDTVAGNTVVFSSAISPQVNDQYWFSNSFNGVVGNTPYFVVSAPNTSAAILSLTYSGVPVTNITSGTGLTQGVRINSGQGATLTNNGANAALVIDGVTVANTNRILIYQQANAVHNGVYVVSNVGNATSAWQLTRSSDMDTYAPDDIDGLDAGDYFFVQAGDTGAGESYVMTAPVGPTIIGYSPLTFTQFSASSTYSAGNGLSLNGTIFSVNVDNDTTAIVADNVVVKAGANLVTPNIGDATGNSLTLSGNGLLSATTVSVTGNVSGGNVNVTSGVYTATVSATGNVLSGNINSNAAVTGVTVTATGNLVGGNANITNGVFAATGSYSGNVNAANINATTNVTGTTITATGNLVGGNANITNGVFAATGNFTGNVSAGNISTSGELAVASISASGNITGGNLVSNADVTTVTVTASGNINGANVNATNGVTASTVNATTITASGNLVGGNANITNGVYTATVSASGNVLAGNVNSNAAVTGVTITATGNLAGGNAVITGDVSGATGTFSGNVSAGNLTTLGNVNGAGGVFTGNVTAQNFFGNISGNIDAGGANTEIQFNDADILAGSAAFTFDKTSNLVTISGNVSAGNLTTVGDTTTATVTASGNVLAANLNSNAAVTGVTVTATGNLEGGNAVITNGVSATTVTATGNVDGGNITTGGQVVATGNVSGGNLNATTGVYSATVTATGNIEGGNITTAGQANLGNIRISGDNITGTNGQVLINSAGADVNFVVSGDTIANLLVVDAGSDTVLIGNGTPITNVAFKVGTTNSMMVPVGNTAQRPGTPVSGMLRFNTSTDVLEYYDSDSWTPASSEFTVITDNQFTGDGSTVNFTLTNDSTTSSTLVSINGVMQIPVTAYSVAGTTLTFTEAPESTDVIDVRILTTTTTAVSISNGSGTAKVEALPTADVEVTGNLIPAANVTYDLGSATAFWNDLYLAGNTIYLGSLQLKDIGSNTFAVFTSDGTTQANLDVGAIDVSQLNSGTSTIGISGPNGNAFVTVGGAANVLVVTTTGANVTGTLSATGNVTGGNLSGTNIVGTLTTAAQTNITSVGTLTSLGVTGNISGGNLLINNNAVITGNLTVNGTETIFNVQTLSVNDKDIIVANNVTGGANVDGSGIQAGNPAVATWFFNNATTSWQSNIGITPTANGTLSLGGASNYWGTAFLTSASVTGNVSSGNLNLTGNLVDTGALTVVTGSNGNITLSPNGSGVIVASKDIVNGQANGVGNIGSATTFFNTVFAKATSAQYADLAEMYEADQIIEPGTVVCFGGAKEVTMCAEDACRRVAGVVSTNPSYLMNSGQTGDHVVPVALQGRVPVRVTGIVRKGDMMVATRDGRARAEADPKIGAIIGKALADFDGQEGVIEVVIGRL